MPQTGGSLGTHLWQLVGCVYQLLRRNEIRKTMHCKMEEKLTFPSILSLHIIKISKSQMVETNTIILTISQVLTLNLEVYTL